MTTKEEKIYRDELKRIGIKPNVDLNESANVPAFLKAMGIYVLLIILIAIMIALGLQII